MNPQTGTFWQQILQHTRLRDGSFTKDNEISERVLHDVLAALMSNKKTGPRARQSSNRVQILRRNRNIARTLYHVRLEPSSRKREIFVKVFDHPRKTLEQRLALAEVENRFHQCAQRRFSALPSLGVAPLIGPFPEQPVVVVEKVRGILLSDLLRRAVWKSSMNRIRFSGLSLWKEYSNRFCGNLTVYRHRDLTQFFVQKRRDSVFSLLSKPRCENCGLCLSTAISSLTISSWTETKYTD